MHGNIYFQRDCVICGINKIFIRNVHERHATYLHVRMTQTYECISASSQIRTVFTLVVFNSRNTRHRKQRYYYNLLRFRVSMKIIYIFYEINFIYYEFIYFCNSAVPQRANRLKLTIVNVAASDYK